MTDRSVPLAALLSLVVPGLGQAWRGRRTRGALILLALALPGLLLFWLELSPLSWLALLPFWAINVADASALAGGQRPNTALLLLLGVLPFYVIGWQVTTINVERFLTNASRVTPLVRGLLQPDIVEQERTIAVAANTFFLPCPAPAAPPPSRRPPAAPSRWVRYVGSRARRSSSRGAAFRWGNGSRSGG